MSERLETAIADKREHPEHEWESRSGARLFISGNLVAALHVSGNTAHPPLEGWTLVEEHKPCAHCGGQAEFIDGGDWRGIRCQRCHTFAVSWEAWDRRVSEWHRMEENPPKLKNYWCIDEDSNYFPGFWDGDWHYALGRNAIAWRDNDVPLWVTR